MADIRVRSTDGLDTDNGGTWALAKATIAGAISASVAGDNIYLSYIHAESSASLLTISAIGSRTAFYNIVSVNDSLDAPSTIQSGASFTTTGSTNLTVGTTSSCGYTSGVIFKCGEGSTTDGRLSINSRNSLYENCTFRVASTSATLGDLRLSALGILTFKNCTIQFDGGNAQKMYMLSTGKFIMDGGTISSGTTTIGLITPTTSSLMVFNNVDLSTCPASIVLVTSGIAGYTKTVFSNCKLPSGWIQTSASTGSFYEDERVELYNCYAGNSKIGFYIVATNGIASEKVGSYRTRGSNNGEYGWCISMATTTLAKFPASVFVGPINTIYNNYVDSVVTLRFEVTHSAQGSGASGNLTNRDFWIELDVPGTLGVISSRTSNTLTESTYPVSLQEWANPMTNKQYIEVSFTPTKLGPITWKPVAAKPNMTVLIDCKPEYQ